MGINISSQWLSHEINKYRINGVIGEKLMAGVINENINGE